MAQAQAKIDYAVMAKSALARIQKHTKEIEAAEAAVKLCREDWRDYGAALLAQRQQTPSDKEFGRWIKTNGLDAPPAQDAPVRSDAIWLARNWESALKGFKAAELKVHWPNDIRQACRDAGYEWAFDQHPKAKARRESEATTDSEGGEVTKPTMRKKKTRGRTSLGWYEAAIDTMPGGQLPRGFPQSSIYKIESMRRAIEKYLGQPLPNKNVRLERGCDLAVAIGKACLKWWEETHSAEVEQEAERQGAEATEQIKEKDRDRFQRLLKKATDAALKKLQASFWATVEEKVKERLKEEFAKEQERLAAWSDRLEAKKELLDAIRASLTNEYGMTEAEYKLILGCLHPDKHSGQEERYNRAFETFRRCVVIGPEGRTIPGRR